MYLVVEFSEVGKDGKPATTVAIIPNIWLIDGTHCYWCPSNVDRAVRLHDSPKTDWPQYEMKVLGSAGAYAEAASMLKRSEYTSELDPTEPEDDEGELRKTRNQAKKKGKKRKIVESSDESDPEVPDAPSSPSTAPSSPNRSASPSSNSGNQPLSPSHLSQQGSGSSRLVPGRTVNPVSPHHPPGKVNRPSTSGSAASERGSETVNVTPAPVPESSYRIPPVTPNRPSPSTSARGSITPGTAVNQSRLMSTPTTSASTRGSVFTAGERIIMAEILKVQETQKVMMSLIQNQARGHCTEETLELPDGVEFPLFDVDAVDHLERELEDKNSYKSVVKHLASVGGLDIKEVTFRLLDAVLSIPVARKYNLTGKKGKKTFKDLRLMNVLIEAVKKNPPTKTATKCDVEKKVMAWFSTVRDKEGGRKERARQSQIDNTERAEDDTESVDEVQRL